MKLTDKGELFQMMDCDNCRFEGVYFKDKPCYKCVRNPKTKYNDFYEGKTEEISEVKVNFKEG